MSFIHSIFQKFSPNISLDFPQTVTSTQFTTEVRDTPVVPIPHMEPFDLEDIGPTQSFKDPNMRVMVEAHRYACTPREPERLLPEWARFAWKSGLVISGLMTPVQMRNKITELWGDQPPEYIWYILGDYQPTREDVSAIVKRFFIGKKPEPGDIEFHASELIYGAGIARIRHPNTSVVPAFLELAGGDFGLYAVGHEDDPRTHYNFYCEAFIKES